MNRCFSRLLLLALALAGRRGLAEEILPAEQVFRPSISAQGDRVQIKIDFPPGHYLYAHRTEINGRRDYDSDPRPQAENDRYLGPTEIWHQPPTLSLTRSGDKYELIAQGCRAQVVCYPPTRWELSLPAATPSGAETNEKTTSAAVAQQPPPAAEVPAAPEPELAAPRKNIFAKRETLSDEVAFRTAFAFEANGDLHVNVQMPEGFYLYKQFIKALHPPQTLNLPRGQRHHDDFLGEQEIYRHQLDFVVPHSQLTADTFALQLQGCEENRLCYPPFQRSVTVPHPYSEGSASAPAATPAPAASAVASASARAAGNNENAGPAGSASSNPSASEIAPASPVPRASQGNAAPAPGPADNLSAKLNAHFLSALFWVWLVGVGVSFTACVYPLVPIVSSLVVGPEVSPARGRRLVLAYVVGMGLAMSLLGFSFALFQINLQIVLQKPLFSGAVALLFLLLALALFDVYSLQMPAFLQKRIDGLSRQQTRGSYVGALVMGALSVLVVSPCATPVLTALLLFATQTTPLKGGLALFIFGVGMGTPLLLFASALKRFLPKAGAWMGTIKSVFAWALLGLGLWLLGRSLGDPLPSLLLLVYLLLLTVYWLPRQLDSRADRAALFVSLLAFCLAVATAGRLGGPTPGSASPTPPAVHFQKLNSPAEVATAIAASPKPVLLDFYADWCVACHQWERDIWANPRFAEALAGYTLLKVDVTAFTPEHKALFQTLQLVGPPAVLRYPARGKLAQPEATLIGEMAADAFAERLASWP